MIQRDFIKRQLEELGRAIAKVITDILKLKEEGKVNEGIVMAQATLKSSFDMDIEQVQSISVDNFIEKLINEKKIIPAQLTYVGDILYETAELFEQKKDTEKAKDLYTKTLLIFNYINQTEKTYSLERNTKMEIIKGYGIK